MNSCIVIVDPFSSGQHLAPKLRELYNLPSVAVLSHPEVPKVFRRSFRPDTFDSIIREYGSIEGLVDELRKRNVRAVLAGSERGVLLADRLSAVLNLPHNVLQLSEARRNKFLMQESIRMRGLASIPQIKTKHSTEAIEWVESKKGWPCIVKPVNSAGTEGVVVCQNRDELEEQFTRQIGKENSLGFPIDELLVQEKLEGTEYVVDTVSSEGRNEVVAVWSYQKCAANGSLVVYDSMTLLNELNSREKTVVDYALRCLNALGVSYGPVHSEIMLTESGPVLIELGARIHGGNGALISGICIGYSQIDRTIIAYLDPQKFASTSKEMYRTEQKVLEIFLINYSAGKFVGFQNDNEIKKLPSFKSMTWGPSIGEYLPLTVDLYTSPGRVILIGDTEEIKADYLKVRAWEKNGGYRVKTKVPFIKR